MTMTRTLGFAMALLVGSAAAARAGVLITQQTTTPADDGKQVTQTHTTTIDGGRMKTVTPEVTTIIDVDAGTMVLMRPAAKSYSEMPLARYGPFMATGLTGEFKPTGKKRTIAGYSCEEYQHDFKAMGEVSSLTCVSKDAPGAAEASAFYARVAEKVAGKDAKGRPDGVVLSEDATVKPVMPEISGIPPEAIKKMNDEQAKRPPIVTKIVVTSIKSEKVPADAFAVPKDYKKEAVPYTQKPGAKPAPKLPSDGISPGGKPR